VPTDEEIGFPKGTTDEPELFLRWLGFLRGAVIRKVEGVSERDARWTPDGRLISLLGIVNHLGPESFQPDGLRPFFEYRSLGLDKLTNGRVGALVARAKPGRHADAPRHTHTLEFQFVYVLKGWAIFEYEGYGEHKLVAGSTVYQPPGIKHKEIAHSDDFEVLEITMPAEFATQTAE